MTDRLNAHALVIGIADYQHVRKLPPVNDAPDVAAVLADATYCGYQTVTSLRDAEATRDAVRRGLAELAAKSRADPDATVFVYFSGHGGRIATGPAAGEYLIPVDAVYPSDADLAATAVSAAEFAAFLDPKQLPARKVVVVFDCCHAGGLGATKDLAPEGGVQPGLSAGYYQALAAGRGRAVLASCRADEFSYVPDGATYGLFTEHLLAGLRGGATGEGGVIDVLDLFRYVQPKVTAAHPRQHPTLEFRGEDLPVARYRGGERVERPRTDGGYLYDAYVCFPDRDPDRTDVWTRLVPRLKAAQLRVAVSNDSEDAGVDRLVGIERAVKQAKRTVFVLSDAYPEDRVAEFQAGVAQHVGLDGGQWRLLPVKFRPFDRAKVPAALARLTTIDLARPYDPESQWDRLVRDLRGPVPAMGG